MTSKHYQIDRQERERIIQKIGQGKEIYSFKVDRGHPCGAELHCITDTGIINIYNAITKKLVTKLIAKPNQIKRYFKNQKEIPNYLLTLARQHVQLGYNNI